MTKAATEKKATAELTIVPQAETPPKGVRRVKNNLRQEWIEEVVPDAQTAPPPTPATPDDSLEFIDNEEDELLAVMLDFEDKAQTSNGIQVFRFIDPAGKTNATAPVEYCGEIPVTRDYLAYIQKAYGGGKYRLEVRDTNGGYKKRLNMQVASLPQALTPTASLPSIAPLTTATLDPDKILEQELTRWERMNKMFNRSGNGNHQGNELDTFLNQLEKFKSLTALLAPEGARTNNPRPESPTTVWDIINNFVGGIVDHPENLQTLLAGIAAFATARNAPESPQVAPQPAGTIAAIAEKVPTQQAATEPQQTQFSTEDEAMYSELINKLINEIIVEAQIERGAGWIRELKAESPALAPIVDVLMAQTPGNVLAFIEQQFPAIVNVPQYHQALGRIAELQTELRKET